MLDTFSVGAGGSLGPPPGNRCLPFPAAPAHWELGELVPALGRAAGTQRSSTAGGVIRLVAAQLGSTWLSCPPCPLR